MSSSADKVNGNVVPLRRAPPRASVPQHEAALYLAQMALELEQLANTAGMEMVGYFLALARTEALAMTAHPVEACEAPEPQAPYRLE